MNKKYYQQLLEELGNSLLKEKNKLSQLLLTEVKKKKYHSIMYSTNDLDIIITFREKQKRRNK